MSDDWSLKGKKVKSTILEFPKEHKPDGTISIPEKWKNKDAYLASDIDTLRQKLIDDFEKEYNESSETFSILLTLPINLSKENIKKIINKRFGVE